MNNFKENPDSERKIDEGRRDAIKKVIKMATKTTVIALAATVLPKNVLAETKSKPKKNPEISPEKLKAIKEAVEEALKDDKYTQNSEEFPEINNGWTSDKNGQMSNNFGIPTGMTSGNINELYDVIGDSNTYGGKKFYKSLPENLQTPYKHFLKELESALILINSTSDGGGMFINGNTENDLGTAYNRLIAMGMVSNWSEAEFRQATAIFTEKVDTINLPARLQNKDLFDLVHIESIKFFTKYFNDKDVFEKGYSGGQTPLERATEKYPENKLKQFIYAMNIFQAFILKCAKEKPKLSRSLAISLVLIYGMFNYPITS